MEIKELLDLIGYSGEADKESISKFIDEKYISRKEILKDSSIVENITGKRIGDILSHYSKLTGTARAEIRDKSIEDLFSEMKTAYESQITEITERGKEGADKQLLDLQTKLEEKDKSIHSYKDANDELKKALEDTQANMDNFKKQTTIGSLLSEVKRKFEFAETATPIAKKGFESLFNEKYKLDLEDDKLIIKDAKGEYIKGDKPGEFATVGEVMKKEMLEHKLLKVNNAGEKPPIKIQSNGSEQTGQFRKARSPLK